MANQGDAGTAEDKPGVNPKNYTVESGMTAQIGISNPKNETVTCTVKSGNTYCTVTNTGLITNTNTGNTDQNATIEVAIGAAKFTVNVTLRADEGLG